MKKIQNKKILINKNKNNDIDIFLASDQVTPSDLDKDEIMIRSSFSSINFKDLLVLKGNPGLVRRFPHTPGIDVSGTVISSKSKKFKVGQKVVVIARPFGLSGLGGFQKYVKIKEKWVDFLPKGMTLKQSMILGICLLSLGLIGLWNISFDSFLLTIFYIVLNLLYSIKLKQIPIVDFMIVATGFVIRILIGGEIGNVELTQWMILMVFLLSLFIAVTKRRDDVYQYELKKKINRKVVSEYTVSYMDKLITIISSVLLVSYLLFITSESVISRYPSKYLIVSFLFVLMGVFRYNQITYVKNKSGSPIKILFKDKFLQITLINWVLTFFFIIYSDRL